MQPTVPEVDEDVWVQCNVRMRKSMQRKIEQRRALVGLSRDQWLRHVIEWALLQPPGTPVHTNGWKRNGHRR